MGLGSGLFGAAIGGLFGGPLGAIIGGSIGLILSAGMGKKASSGDRQQVTINILSVVFQCLGKLAKSDGRVSEDEAEYIRELLHSMVPDADIRKLLIAEFNSGRDSSETFDSMVKRLANLLNSYSTFEFKTQIMYIFCTLTVVDRQVDKNEFEMLKTAGITLGCPEVVDRFFAGYQYRQQNSSSQNSCSSAISLQQCYTLLDISETASDMEVKKAYRKKAMECHPDKAQAAGLSAVMIEEAKKKFQDISNAYETIRKARNMQ